jgi:segregation and condensation protein A
MFEIKTESFVGPLELLLDLIEKRKLLINDISLSKVTDDFIKYVEGLNRGNNRESMGDSAQFILIASTLLLIKSKSLLPTLTLTEEEEQGIFDLETRLRIYKEIKDAGQNINKIFGKNVLYTQEGDRKLEPVFSPHKSMTVDNLLSGIKNIINSIPKKENIPKAFVKKIISLEETINSLTQRITSGLRMSFTDFTKEHKEEKVNIIVSFLAMLELVKQGVIDVTQDKNFGDINMETKNVSIPRYN